MKPPVRDPLHGLIRSAALVSGWLIASTSGLCTLVFGVGIALPYSVSGSDWREAEFWQALGAMLSMIGVFGGVPFLVGVLLIRGSRDFRAPDARQRNGE